MPGAAPYPGAAPLRPPPFNPSPAGPGRPVPPRGGGGRHGGRAHPRGRRPPAGDKRGQKRDARGQGGRAEGGQCPLGVWDPGGAPTRDAGTREWVQREWGRGGRTAEEPPRDLGTRRGGPVEPTGVLGRSEGASRARDTGGQRGGGAREVAPLCPHAHAGPWRCPRCRSGRCPRCQPRRGHRGWVAPAPPGCPACVPPSRRGVTAAPRVGRGTRGRARLRRHNLAPAVFAVPSPARLPASEISQAGETDAGGERWASRAARG